MNKTTRNGLIILAILVLAFFITQYQQNRTTTTSTRLFDGNVENIHKILIQKGETAIELVREAADAWEITGNDTLLVRENRITNLFEDVLTVERETLVSRNPEKYDKFAIDDSTGTHLALIDVAGNTSAYYVFGRSRTDWAHNYVRTEDEPEVYLTSKSVIHHLSTSEQFWGEEPKPEEEPLDSLAVPPIQMDLSAPDDTTLGTITLPAKPVNDPIDQESEIDE